jgi:hypothetical protein
MSDTFGRRAHPLMDFISRLLVKVMGRLNKFTGSNIFPLYNGVVVMTGGRDDKLSKHSGRS